MHKSSGKHMPDSSDEYKIDTDATTDSEEERKRRKKPEDEESEQQANEEKRKALSDLIKKTAVVPLEKLPEDVTKAKTEELQAHLSKCSFIIVSLPTLSISHHIDVNEVIHGHLISNHIIFYNVSLVFHLLGLL